MVNTGKHTCRVTILEKQYQRKSQLTLMTTAAKETALSKVSDNELTLLSLSERRELLERAMVAGHRVSAALCTSDKRLKASLTADDLLNGLKACRSTAVAAPGSALDVKLRQHKKPVATSSTSRLFRWALIGLFVALAVWRLVGECDRRCSQSTVLCLSTEHEQVPVCSVHERLKLDMESLSIVAAVGERFESF